MAFVRHLSLEQFLVHEAFRDCVAIDEDAVGLLHAFC